MTLSSMTGFARTDGVCGPYAWSWELKSLNAKGLELRFRVPAGWDSVEVQARAQAKAIARGTLYGNLSVRREGASPSVRVNQEVLAAVVATMREIADQVNARPPTVDGILGIKGVIEISEQPEDDADHARAEAAVLEGFATALSEMLTMRRTEGAALSSFLEARLNEIDGIRERADAAPGRQADAIKARLAEQVAALLDASDRLDADRLHQEALLLAAKADVREELDRLAAHVAQARRLLADGGPIGRRLDFLSQELNREANTICAKSNDVELTTLGLELKSVVEQFREQVQNLE